MSRYPVLFLLAACTIIGLACSNGSSTSPLTAPDLTSQSIAPKNHVAWGVFDLVLDTETGSAQIVWDRGADAHLNVTKKVQSPVCPDCVVVMNPYYNSQTHRFTVTVSFKNPTQLTGFDVRGVISDPGGDKYLANADGITDVWGNPMQYKAINVDAERTFGPGETHERLFDFYLPGGENFQTLTYIIDASYPDYVEEPCAEEGYSDPVVNNNFSTTFLRCRIWDHQGDLVSVIADMMPLGGNPMTPMYDDGAHNDGAAGDGVYGISGVQTGVAVGLYMINVYPMDALGHMGWGQIPVSVQQTTGGPNDPPIIQSITSDKTTANGSANEKIKITVTAIDPNGDPLDYQFSGAGSFSGQNGGVVNWKPASSELGGQDISIKVVDDQGGEVTGSIKLWSTNLTIVNGSTSGAIPTGSLPCALPDTTIDMGNDFKGQVVYCNFWATWCGYCVAEMPELDSVYQQFKSNPEYNHILINVGEDEATALGFFNANGYEASYWALDQNSSYFGKCNDFNGNSNGIPQHVLFDRDNKCRWAHIGALSSTAELVAAIEQLL